MAEITAPTKSRNQAGVKKSKKLSTRVDLTPMVDLGFLLITFFIFTITMTQPSAMRLILPADGAPTATKASSVITFLLGRNSAVYYYEGADPASGSFTSVNAIRSIILDKARRTDPAWFEIILKPSRDCTYGNAVRLLDEMKIDAVPHYALVDITPEEYRLLQPHP